MPLRVGSVTARTSIELGPRTTFVAGPADKLAFRPAVAQVSAAAIESALLRAFGPMGPINIEDVVGADGVVRTASLLFHLAKTGRTAAGSAPRGEIGVTMPAGRRLGGRAAASRTELPAPYAPRAAWLGDIVRRVAS